MKRIVSLIIICVFMLTACTLPTVDSPDITTLLPGQTTPSGGSTTTSPEVIETPVYDYMNEDLTAFVELCDYKGISIEDKRVTVTDEMVTRYINELLISNKKFTEVKSGVINEYDIVNMDYVGKLDGVPFDNGSDKDFTFLVSEADYICGFSDRARFITGFAAAMIGKNIANEFDINVTFPEDYGAENLAGKAAVFSIKVNYILKADELTEENFKVICKEEGLTIDSYKKQLKEDMIDAYDESARSEMDGSMWDYIMANTTFKALPDEYINKYYEAEISQLQAMATLYGMPLANVLGYYGYESEEDLRESLVSGIKEMIILYQIIKNEQLTIIDTEFDVLLEDLSKDVGYTTEQLLKDYGKDYLLEYFYFERVTDLLYSNAVIVPAK